MKICKSATTNEDAGDRRGDDTHWWKAYQVHATAAPGTTSHSTLRSPGAASLSFADERFGPTETQIHRAAKMALRSLQTPSVAVEPPSDRDSGPSLA